MESILWIQGSIDLRYLMIQKLIEYVIERFAEIYSRWLSCVATSVVTDKQLDFKSNNDGAIAQANSSVANMPSDIYDVVHLNLRT
jgi:hypothetical protein